KFWSTKSIAYYLAWNNRLRDRDDKDAFPIVIPEATLELLPSWDKPHYKCEGRSIKQLFDQLLDRRRLLGYRVYLLEEDPDDPDAPPTLRIESFTYSGERISLGAGNFVEANLNQFDLQFDAA